MDHAQQAPYFEAIAADPQHLWTPDEQIRGAVDWADPLGPPGEAFSYSDTGYVLLGQVIEKVTGEPLGPAVRALLRFDALGLDATWWEIMEPAGVAAERRAHQ